MRLANLAAGIKVGKRGTACVSAKELIDSIPEDFPEPVRRRTGFPRHRWLGPKAIARNPPQRRFDEDSYSSTY